MPTALLPDPPHCTCSHRETVHEFGKRQGRQVRTWCTVWDSNGKCPCREFVAEGSTGE